MLEEAESPQAIADRRPVTERLYVENVAYPSRLFPRLLRLSRSLPDSLDSSRRLPPTSLRACEALIALALLPLSTVVLRLFVFSLGSLEKRHQRPCQRVAHCDLISILDIRSDFYLLSSHNSCMSVTLGQESLQSFTVTTAYGILICVALDFQAQSYVDPFGSFISSSAVGA